MNFLTKIETDSDLTTTLTRYNNYLLSYLKEKGYTIKDGRVYDEKGRFAVLYSPGYGAGWSTWADNDDMMLYSPIVVALKLFFDDILDDDIEDKIRNLLLDLKVKFEKFDTPSNVFISLLMKIYHGLPLNSYFCTLGYRDLTTEFLDPGTRFIIEEYDGSESIKFDYSINWKS